MTENDVKQEMSTSQNDNMTNKSNISAAEREGAGEWVSDPALNQPAYAAYGRPDGYGRERFTPNAGVTGNNLANQSDASAYAASGDFPSSSFAAGGYGPGPSYGSGPAMPPPQTPPAPPAESVNGGRKWPWLLAMVLLALLAGFGGALIQTNTITAKVTEEITADIEAYMKDAGATVLYRAVETTAKPAADAAIDVAAVTDLAADSVVEIATEYVSTDMFSWFYSGSNVQQGAGSGVILSEDGYILTCYHVIDGANTITVATREGQTFDATLVGGDKEEDIAVLKIEAEGLTPAVLGDSDALVVGSPVVAIGNPLGQLGGTITSGIVSALERELKIEEETYTLIQTDAAINGGNSGGGLFNAKGELVGLVNAKASSLGVEGLGFAIPIDNIDDYIEDIISYGYVTSKVTLGVTLIDIVDERTALNYRVDELGVYILYVQDNSNASYAGLQSGDRIVSADDIQIAAANELIKLIEAKSAGDVLELEIVRGGETLHMSITLYGSLPEGDQAEQGEAQQI